MYPVRSVSMWSLWKEVLLPGRQQDAKGNWLSFSPADVRAAHANAQKMLARGLPVPCVWEHQPVEVGDSEAWKARYAKYTFAHVAGARLNDRGALELLHTGRDERDRDQLLKTRYVSPKVYPSYSDSLGNTYRGTTVAHVAATPTPVQHWQRPFELSQPGALYLSYLPDSEGDMADDKGSDKDGDKGGDKKGGEGDGKKSGLSAIIDALREKGFNIPDEVTSENELVIAIKASSAGPGDAGDDLDDGLDAPPGGDAGMGTAAPAGGPPMMMSTTDRDPEKRRQAQGWAKQERADLKARIVAAFNSGRVTRPTARQLLRQVEAVEMSFTRDGAAVCPLHAKVTEVEKLAANSAWSPTSQAGRDLSNTRDVGRPASLGNRPDDPKGQEEATDLILSMIPGTPAAKK